MSIFSILNYPCSLVVNYYLFSVFYHSKVLFSGFLQFKGNFIDFIIKTRDKKRRFDFQVVEKANEIYIYKKKLGRENVQR